MTAEELKEAMDFIKATNQPGWAAKAFREGLLDLAVKAHERREAEAERLRLETDYLRARWGRRPNRH